MMKLRSHRWFVALGAGRRKQDTSGKLGLAGMTCIAALFCAATVIASHGQTFTTLASFDDTNGAYPLYGGLVRGADQNFFGTAEIGGSSSNDGAVFEFSPATGVLRPIHRFCLETGCPDGRNPAAGLLPAGIDEFYGTTTYGGTYGGGTVFYMDPSGYVRTLYDFCQQTDVRGFCTDGEFPQATLVVGPKFDLYGTTSEGGSPNGNYGAIFVISHGATFHVIYRFCQQTGCADGINPNTLVLGTDGNLYGTAVGGGANGSYGTVFKTTTLGQMTTLYSFCAHVSNDECTDGANPSGALVQGTDGNFYGTTSAGGSMPNCGVFNTGCGTLFQITPSGVLTTLYSFCSQPSCADGSYPNSLTLGSDGNFYGTTSGGGAGNRGTIFELTPAGEFTQLHTFCMQANCTDGATPNAPLLESPLTGVFYGTTSYGGTSTACSVGCGTVFSLSLGLESESSPFF